ncbi:MAG: MBL fold metallo-hydrolase [Clostridia bacterium]|nr:MBL fold metallo-hydrolase [Clostridia bacterium]
MEKNVPKPSFRRYTCFVAMLLFLTVLFPGSSPKARADSDILMVCLNIGKADAILVKGEGWAYLIDTGYEQSFPAIQEMLSQYGVQRLDGVFLTHCHKDHSGSLMSLAQSGTEISAWFGAEIYYDIKPQKHPLLLAANEAGASVVWLKAGDVIQAGPDASFTVLGPLAVDTGNENNNSLVMRFTSPYGSILLCGDMKEAEENSLLSAGVIIPCDILKCGHHGDSGATSAALLSAVRPKYAVISTATGEEEDTPSPKTLQRLHAAGASVYVTQDFQDAVEFRLGSGGITTRDVTWNGIPERVRGLKMRISLVDDTVSVFNTASSDIIVEEAVLYSSKGTQLFDLGDLLVPAKGSVVIGSAVSPSSCDYYVQSKKRVWHNEELDTAVLYDQWGRPLAWADNGLPE